MFSPVPMRRLQAVVLARDERAVLRGLGELDVVHLTRADAEAPLSSPPDHLEAIARCDRLWRASTNWQFRTLPGPPRRWLSRKRKRTCVNGRPAWPTCGNAGKQPSSDRDEAAETSARVCAVPTS